VGDGTGPRKWKWKLALALLAATYACLGGYDLVATALSGQFGVASAAPTARAVSVLPTRPQAAPGSTALAPASSPATHLLTATSVTAFGPEGAGDGDHPDIASRIDGGGAQPWLSSWYVTPEFGNLQSGTGLLLDMGEPVTVSSVRLVLGRPLGADVQVRVGNRAALASMATVVSAADVGGAVRLLVTSAPSGRYVLVWFTRLPPNSAGNYQVEVYDIAVYGTP
jgi:hypothetical protein